MYLLDVLSSDKTSEITSLISLNASYQALSSKLPSSATSLMLKTALAHHTHRFFNPIYASLISSITSETPTTKHIRETSTKSPNIAAENYQPPPPFALPPSDSEDTLTLRSQYVRFLPPPPTTPPTRHGYLSMVEEVLGKYFNAEKEEGRDEEYRREISGGLEGTEKDWVYLVTPFVCCLTRPVAVFLGFQRFMERLGKPLFCERRSLMGCRFLPGDALPPRFLPHPFPPSHTRTLVVFRGRASAVHHYRDELAPDDVGGGDVVVRCAPTLGYAVLRTIL